MGVELNQKCRPHSSKAESKVRDKMFKAQAECEVCFDRGSLKLASPLLFNEAKFWSGDGPLDPKHFRSSGRHCLALSIIMTRKALANVKSAACQCC